MGAGRTGREAEREYAVTPACLAGDGDRAVARRLESMSERAVSIQVLPAVRLADESAAQMLDGRACRQAECETASLRIRCPVIEPCAIVAAVAAEVRCEDEDETVVADQRESHEQHVAQRIREDFQRELIVLAVVHDVERRQRGTRSDKTVAALALQIDPAPVADEVEAEIPDLRLTGRGPVDFVDDSMADRRPEPRAIERRGHEILVAR